MDWGECAHIQFAEFIQAAASRLQGSEVLQSLFSVFWSKMHFKLVSELSSCELRTVFRRIGKTGEFHESLAIPQITIFLFRIGQDPFTYRFPISPSKLIVEATVIKEAEDNVHDAIDIQERSCHGYYRF